MPYTKLFKSLGLGLLVLSIDSSLAADSSGWFVDGRWVRANMMANNYSSGTNVGVGYSLNRYFAVEGGYWNGGDYSLYFLSAPLVHRKIGIDGLTAGFTGTWSLPAQWFLDGRMGILRWNADVSNDSTTRSNAFVAKGTDYYNGLGLGYRVTESLSISLNADHYKINRDQVHVIGMGAQFAF